MTNQIHDAFDPIKASEKLKSSTMRYLQSERERRNSCQIRRKARRTICAAVCAMLALFVGIGGYDSMMTPVSYISIDVNPSVELALNRYDRVISTTAYNEDGEVVLDGIHVTGKLYTDAIDIIVESKAMQTYLTEESLLTVTVAAHDNDKENAILTGIQNSGCQLHDGQNYTADVSTIAAAHDNGLSFGKYAAYLVLSQYDSTVTTKDCQHMSMTEIHHQISEHENGSEHNGRHNVGEDEDTSNPESESTEKTHGHGYRHEAE